MHDEYDEEVEFLDTSPTYICDQPNIHELLGLTKDRHHECKGIFYCKLYFFTFINSQRTNQLLHCFLERLRFCELYCWADAIVFYKHMRDSQGEWEVSDLTPLRVKIPKAVSHTPSDLFATIEWFYCQGSGGEDHGMKSFNDMFLLAVQQSGFFFFF